MPEPEKQVFHALILRALVSAKEYQTRLEAARDVVWIEACRWHDAIVAVLTDDALSIGEARRILKAAMHSEPLPCRQCLSGIPHQDCPAWEKTEMESR